MLSPAELTLPEKILLAAAGLEEAGQSPFSAEALVIRTWQLYPRTFGLKGYEEQHPDSNKVLWGIMGEKGLPRRGWLAKVGQKLYSLTDEGRQMVRRLQLGEQAPKTSTPAKPRQPHLTRPQDLLLQSLLATAAWSKRQQGRQMDWTFTEAVRFWDLGERRGRDVDERLVQRRSELDTIAVELHTGSVRLGNGSSVSAGEVGQLIELHDALVNRFARHLNLLRNRGERAVG
jgi:hypothetical protein